MYKYMWVYLHPMLINLLTIKIPSTIYSSVPAAVFAKLRTSTSSFPEMEIFTPPSSSSSSPSYDLEITVLSAESLTLKRRHSVKKNTFTAVHTDPYIHQTTSIDTEGGSHPTWNEKLLMCMPMHATFITVAVYYQCKTSLLGNNSNKMVGMVRVPVSDFIGGNMPRDYLHFLSYRLRDQYGNKNGIVNFTIKVRGSLGGHEEPSSSWPRDPDVRDQQSCSSGRPNQVVTGVPAVWVNQLLV